MKNKGFTLAEVLITLGIIGVVAALTIPSLIQENQKRVTATRLQRAISVLNQAYRRAYDEVGELTPEEAKVIGKEEYFKQYWAPFIKASLVCTSTTQCLYDSSTPFYAISGDKQPMELLFGGPTFYTADGFLYYIRLYSGAEKNPDPSIFVDINGAKKPNMYGKDVFRLIRVIGENGGVVVPDCSNYSNTSINNNCSKNGIGVCCAEKIRRAGWKIEKDYPW